MDGHSVYNACLTLTPHHNTHSYSHLPIQQARPLLCHPWWAGFFCLLPPDSGWTQTKTRDRMDRGGDEGRIVWMLGVRLTNCAHLLSNISSLRVFYLRLFESFSKTFQSRKKVFLSCKSEDHEEFSQCHLLSWTLSGDCTMRWVQSSPGW